MGALASTVGSGSDRFSRGPRSDLRWFGLAAVPIALYVVVLFLSTTASGAPRAVLVSGAPTAGPAPTTILYENASQLAPAATPAAAPVGAASSSSSSLALQVAVNPSTICADNSTGCPAGTSESRVTLSAAAINAPTPFWPDVQVAFIIETTAYDGVFDHYNSFYGQDPCAAATSGQGPVCEESNGVPFFIQNGGAVADAIQGANPHSNVTFALVDFFGTDCGDWDDCGDGYKYHVDISTFIPANSFGPAIHSTFQSEVLGGGWDGIFGLDDNFLHSPSITALYGTIIGSGLDWSPNSHHVIVLIGSTAPRDPSYAENYYYSAFDHCCSGTQADGWTCEPAYQFGNGLMPNCEGWVRSQDGNPNDSIAALAHTATQCTESVGHVCTIDMVDLYDTATDPESQGWPVSTGYPIKGSAGPGSGGVIEDVDHVILAGCDLAAATGGTWDGPVFATCPNGQSGTLQYVPHGALSQPNTENPSLFEALKGIGFGPIYASLAANGTSKPIFNFVPFGGLKVAQNPEFTAACAVPGGFLKTCQMVPTESLLGGRVTTLGWNWSTNSTTNALYAGDVWTASFNVVSGGPPTGLVPVDACITTTCKASGSGPYDGEYTWATYRAGNNVTIVTESFPLALINIQLSPTVAPPPVTPPAPPVPPPTIPILTAPATPLPVLTPTLQSLGIFQLSAQPTAAGLLGAGFTAITVKNRPVAMKVAALSKNPAMSKFDKVGGEGGPGIGRFE